MRILHVLQQLPMKTGSGVYYTNLIEELDKHGHENIMLYANQNEFDFPKSDLRFEVEFKSDRLPFPIMGMSDIMPYDSTVFSEATDEMLDKVLAAYREKLIYIKENLKPDIIISHHLFLVTNLVKEVFADQKVYAFCHGTDLRQIGQHEKFKKMLPNIPKLERFFTVAPGEDAKISAIFD
ncbi:MAG: glycosyl transferase family 1, partial [Ezakiella massiliensis]